MLSNEAKKVIDNDARGELAGCFHALQTAIKSYNENPLALDTAAGLATAARDFSDALADFAACTHESKDIYGTHCERCGREMAMAIDANNIAAPHDVTDESKTNTIAESLERDGWLGRSVLVIDMGGTYRALTGSHRIAAAARVGVDVPCLVINADDLAVEQNGVTLSQRIDRAEPDDYASILIDYLGESHPASQLMMEEQ